MRYLLTLKLKVSPKSSMVMSIYGAAEIFPILCEVSGLYEKHSQYYNKYRPLRLWLRTVVVQAPHLGLRTV